MINFEVTCPMSDCQLTFDYNCEPESAGDGSEHSAECPSCKREIHFEISYEPVVSNETYRG